MQTERDAYAVLQVSRWATWAEIKAAYRTLARRYHPDSGTPDSRRMVELNAAYEGLERERRRLAAGSRSVPVGPGRPASEPEASPAPQPLSPLQRRIRARERLDSPVIDFGQYAGWRVADVAARDPNYLRFLSRHSSGVRFRAAIEAALGLDAGIGRPSAVVR